MEFARRGDAAQQAANIAIKAAEKHANQDFLEKAYRAGVFVAKNNQELNSGMIRATLEHYYPDAKTHDDRALGALMRKLASDRIIEVTDITRKSGNRRNHNRPLRVWRSLVYEG